MSTLRRALAAAVCLAAVCIAGPAAARKSHPIPAFDPVGTWRCVVYGHPAFGDERVLLDVGHDGSARIAHLENGEISAWFPLRGWEIENAQLTFTDSRAGMIAASRNGANPKEVTNFAAWITGDAAAALDLLPAADAGRAVIDEIARIRPASRGELEFVALHSWGADAYAGGAWAYFRPGDVTRFAGIIGRAHGRLHFCGEHLALENRGMEGAMESGERAAADVLEEI